MDAPREIQEAVKPFDDFIDNVMGTIPPGPDCTEVLELLLDAKDYAMRAHVSAPSGKKWDPLACRWVEKNPALGSAIRQRTTGA
jgi:hypothetical protein